MLFTNNQKQKITSSYKHLLKEGYFIRKQKFTCKTINYSLVKNTINSRGLTVLQYLSKEVVTFLKDIEFKVKEDREITSALNFNPKFNVPSKWEIIKFKN